MLLRFTVSNHRSIFDPVELSMIAIDDDRAATRGFDQLSERVLTVAGIYGANASGKSNVLDAIAWLSHAVRDSLRQWPEDTIPREPHQFGSGPTTPSSFAIEFVANGVRYDYALEVDDSDVRSESLHSYPFGRRRVLFTRERDTIEFRRGTTNQRALKQWLTPTSLGLTAARRLGHEDFMPAADFISKVGAWSQTLAFPPRHPMSRRAGWRYFGPRHATERIFDTGSFPQHSMFEELDSRAEQRDAALALLKFADLGIDDVKFEEEDMEGISRPRRLTKLVHRTEAQAVPFELKDESAGTVAWFRLIGPVLTALKEGWLLLVDEIDASLHPQLSARLLLLFHDPDTNPRGAQLVFTTHDTTLLGVLNRDQVWLTDKDANGATSLTALSDFKADHARKTTNLERAYLQGRFGGVPDLDPFTLKRALAGGR